MIWVYCLVIIKVRENIYYGFKSMILLQKHPYEYSNLSVIIFLFNSPYIGENVRLSDIVTNKFWKKRKEEVILYNAIQNE